MTGRQYCARAEGSAEPWAKLAASGVTFQENASSSVTAAGATGRHARRENVSRASGTATYRRRTMFSPTLEGIAKTTTQAHAYAAKTKRRMRARSTRQVKA